MTRNEFLRGTVFGGMFAACPALARAADAAAGVKPPERKAKTPGMEALSELYRIGHGPSSSHTMGPYRASETFLARHKDAARFEATLYGSLSSTGKGHFTDKAITDVLGGEASRVVRMPGGNLSEEMVLNLQPYIDYEIGWNIDTQDWTLPGAEAIYQEMISVDPGDIVLCHDGGGDRSQTVEALRRAIPYLKSKGFTFLTMDEMLEYPAVA